MKYYLAVDIGASSGRHILAHLEDGKIVPASDPVITCQCIRVPVLDGHTAAVFVNFGKKPTKEQIIEKWRSFR